MKQLENYYKACEDLKKEFLKNLYPDADLDYAGNTYWIGDEIGGVLSFNDCFVHMEHIADYFQYKLTPDDFFVWWDDYIDERTPNLNMKTFKKLQNSGRI